MGMTEHPHDWYISSESLNAELVMSWIDGTITSSDGMSTFPVVIYDLMVNWKNATQGLSSHSRQIYTLLDLSSNKLSGDIPASLGNLKKLKLLNISNNRLSGYIPPSFGDPELIETLDFQQ
ncbi:hypothetical protein POM88_007282 [Heracleum sosnowskyi]|uniref:Uncharacterized protein n=1 Tax=Heracleum sosnowskyi TaxID=360622 RepID=A0AAD8J4D8_9APIA|nr:hypothetical protein POM88_007282 [Heracleum sosnowskyi]